MYVLLQTPAIYRSCSFKYYTTIMTLAIYDSSSLLSKSPAVEFIFVSSNRAVSFCFLFFSFFFFFFLPQAGAFKPSNCTKVAITTFSHSKAFLWWKINIPGWTRWCSTTQFLSLLMLFLRVSEYFLLFLYVMAEMKAPVIAFVSYLLRIFRNFDITEQSWPSPLIVTLMKNLMLAPKYFIHHMNRELAGLFYLLSFVAYLPRHLFLYMPNGEWIFSLNLQLVRPLLFYLVGDWRKSTSRLHTLPAFELCGWC